MAEHTLDRAEERKCARTQVVPKSRHSANIYRSLVPLLASSSVNMLGLAIALIVLWIIVRVFFKVTKLVIHVLLIVGLIALTVHFLNAPR
jgi:hypothetical protein